MRSLTISLLFLLLFSSQAFSTENKGPLIITPYSPDWKVDYQEEYGTPTYTFAKKTEDHALVLIQTQYLQEIEQNISKFVEEFSNQSIDDLESSIDSSIENDLQVEVIVKSKRKEELKGAVYSGELWTHYIAIRMTNDSSTTEESLYYAIGIVTDHNSAWKISYMGQGALYQDALEMLTTMRNR